MAAGEQGPGELAPAANESHSRSIQEKETTVEKFAPVIVETLIRDQYANGSDGVVCQESAVQEPQESLEG